MMRGVPNITGSKRIEERTSGRVWVAFYMTAAGKPSRKVLGPAWAKDTGRKTPRGAPVWRAADGTCPDGYLTPKDAQGVLDDLLAAEKAKPHTSVRHHGRTLQDAVDEWLRHREKEKGCAETTMKDYRATSQRDLLSFFGADLPLRRVTVHRVEALQTHLLTTKTSPRTAQKVMVMLSGIFALAVRRGWMPANPCDSLEKIPTRRKKDLGHVLAPDQVYAVARALLEPSDDETPRLPDGTVDDAARSALREARRARYGQDAAAIIVSAFTGLRAGELRALRWQDVDFANGVIRVRQNLPAGGEQEKAPKSGEGRTVPLIPQAAAELDALSRRGYLDGPADRVIVGKDGLAVPEGSLRIALYEGLERAGLSRLREKPASSSGPPPFNWHSLRHSFGTIAAQAFALRDVQAYMGHADIQTTEIYLHHVPQHDAGKKLGNLIAAKLDPLGTGLSESATLGA